MLLMQNIMDMENRSKGEREVAEYKEIPLNEDMKKRKDYWEVAKGLQKVDNLETSQYLEEVIQGTLDGSYDTYVANDKVAAYYKALEDRGEYAQAKEADMSAARITLVLEQAGFTFSPTTLLAMHKDLFCDGVLEDNRWAGKIREVSISKDEPVLNGRSVEYAHPSAIRETLNYDFEEECQYRYQIPFSKEQTMHFSRFAARVWQVHPFREGNTRAIATFLMLYLRSLGIDINNEPFRNHSRYFRDALVRSQYMSIKDAIYEDYSFLEKFFDNILTGAVHDLENQDLRCMSLFESV